MSKKLLLWMMALALAPVLITNAVGYGSSRGIIVRLVSRYLGALAQGQAQHARDQIDRHLLRMHTVAAGNAFLLAGARHALGLVGGPMVRVATAPELTRVLQQQLGELPGFSSLYEFTPGGLRIGAAGVADDAVMSDLPADLLQTQVDVLPAGAGRAEPRFRLLSPITDADGHVVALLGGTVPMTALRDALELPPAIAASIESFVIDESGRPLITARGSSALDFATPVSLPIHFESGSADLYRNHAGIEVFGASALVPGYRWRIIAEAPAADALDDLRRLGELSLVLEVLLVVGVVVASLLVTRRFIAPIRRLVRASQRVAEGDFATRVPIEADDEVGELGAAFNEMTIALDAANARVRELYERDIAHASQMASVGELATGVAHEIKNPLVGIASGLDLVRRHVTNVEELDPIIDEMSRQLTRIQGTLQDMLMFAKPITPTLSSISAPHVIARALRLVQPAADRQGVTIDVHVDAEVPRFLADEELLRQALVNLLMNAMQATAAGDRIRVRATADATFVHIAVEDSGHGVDSADLDSVFKRFFTTRHTGTGLGLPITREIVERHGGSLELRSDPGRGTAVTMRFPIRVSDDRTGDDS